MADIFISYAREDRETVAKLAAALEAAGHSLWWDRHVAAGDEFSAEIERELKAAKAVIVAWSPQAAQSHWVKDEACHARDAGKLVPVSLDGGEPPMGFRQFQTISFAGWVGDVMAAPIQTLRESLAKKTGAGVSPAPTAAAAPTAQPTARRAMPVLWIAAAGAFTVVLVGGAVWLFAQGARHSKEAASPLPPSAVTAPVAAAMDDKSIAVLPFKNFSPDKENEYFADGLTEELLNRLANVGGLKVTSRTSSFAFKDKDTALPEIARQLGVRHILEGSVRRDGGDLRVTAQLIDVSTDSHLWSETYDRKIEKIFVLQDEIAIAVTDALKVALLSADDKPLAPVPTTSVELYGDYLKARADLATFRFEPMRAAEASLNNIVAADPKFVPAATTLVALLLRMGETGIYPAAEVYGRAKPLVDRVLALDERNAEAWLARAEIEAYEGHAGQAAKARRRAHALASDNPGILQDQILQIYWARQPVGAEAPIQRLITLDPLSMFSYIPAAFWYHRTGDTDRYRATIARMSELFPDNPGPQFLSLVTPAPEEDNAIILRKAMRGYALERTDPDIPAFIAAHLLDAGQPAEAGRYVDEARALDPNHALVQVADALAKLYGGDGAGALGIADKLARPEAATRWGSRELALRMLAASALVQDNRAAMRKLVPIYLSVYPDMDGGDLTSRSTWPAFYVKWGHFMSALDLAVIYERLGDAAEAKTLVGALRQELLLWPRRGIFGTGFADAELHAVQGDDEAAVQALSKAAHDGLTENWWFFLDHSPHFARLRKMPEFAAIRAEFATRAALPKDLVNSVISKSKPN